VSTSILEAAPVMPVVIIDDPADAVPLARALVAGGIAVIEVTLRTPRALEAIRAIAAHVPEMRLGAGTVNSPDQVKLAADAGAQFLVSPGATDRLLDAMSDSGLTFLAGTATPSDMLRLIERGITEAKLFPATALGGVGLLRAVQSPLPQLRFCPTGGITPANAPDFLALPNVGCVGGTWLTPQALIAAGDWAAIEELAAQAARLGRAAPREVDS
jgi:2-dehydro-3-deoxyphosphogluconate aldolase / (4S)-4-hydroxy-2-oxoglutarate aldolase